MKQIFSKTYKLGRFTVSIFSNEIVVVYIGDRKIHIKTFHLRIPFFGSTRPKRTRKPRLKQTSRLVPRISIFDRNESPRHRVKLAFALAIAIASVILIFSLYPAGDDGSDMQEDEVIKNNLVESSQTDYSNPEKRKKLVISEHRVVPGESLQKIAKKYGVSVDTIRGTNNLTSDLLRVGIVLKIPNKDGLLYKVPKGGGLVAIAEKYRVSLKKIIDENDLQNPDFVATNTVLFIPDAKPLNIFTGFLWPAPRHVVTCGYGWRRNPFNPGYREFHSGIDIRASYQWIRASKYGKVTYTGWLGGYGKTVVIAHPGGYKTLYAHLSRIIVRSGQYVKQGQTIAMSGNTGRSTGAHLHFEIIKHGKSNNPYIYFRKRRR